MQNLVVNPFSSNIERDLSEIKTVLEQPFPPELIKQREGSRGAMLDYIEGWAIIQRLNNAFNTDWSFTVLEWKVIESDIIVLGRLTARGIIKDAFGGSKVNVYSSNSKVIDLGSDIKAAATDSLKKCATLFGVGLHLYQKAEPRLVAQPTQADQPPVEKPDGNGNGNNGNGRITAKQLAYIFSIAKDKSLTNEGVKTIAFQRFNRSIEFLSKSEASDLIQFLQQKAA